MARKTGFEYWKTGWGELRNVEDPDKKCVSCQRFVVVCRQLNR